MELRTAVARRIDTMLKRELGEGIDVQRMLKTSLYTRDVLLVCEAVKGSELPALARQFREASVPKAVPPVLLPLSQELLAWSADTSGFGLSCPPAQAQDKAPRRLRFFKSGWFARSASRWLVR